MESASADGGEESATGQSASTTPQQQPQTHPPPSPLSGCYLLVVLSEPRTAQHKDLILNRLAKGESASLNSLQSFYPFCAVLLAPGEICGRVAKRLKKAQGT